MKLIHKLLLGYLTVVVIVGGFSTALLMYNINKHSSDLSVYREREIASFTKVIDAFIYDKSILKDIDHLQGMFLSITKELPHIKRLTLHAQDEDTQKYRHIASSIVDIIGMPSHREDIEAIEQDKTVILYENMQNENFIDITQPIHDSKGNAIAALGVTVSLTESDIVLRKAMQSMREDALSTIFIALFLTTALSLLFSFLTSKKIISPLEKLKKAVKKISANKRYQKIEIDSNDEIGELAAEFNKMSYELNLFHTSMEEKISSKTEELKLQYFTDSLTSMPNREALFEDMKTVDYFGLAILDVAAFKNINDVYGVNIGNRVLVELSKKYFGYLFSTKLKVYRISGDEVAILNPKVMKKEQFINTIQNIITSIEREIFYFKEENIEINISIHAGIVCEKELALEKANIALIQAKKDYLDFCVYKEENSNKEIQKENIKMISKIKIVLKIMVF